MKIKAKTLATLLISFGRFIAAENAIGFAWTFDIRSTRQFLPGALREPMGLPEPLHQLALDPVDLLSLLAAVVMVEVHTTC